MEDHTSDFPTTDTAPEPVSDSTTIDSESILRHLDAIQREIEALRHALTGAGASAIAVRPRPMSMSTSVDAEGARIIEGVFDGQNMVGPDGKQYSVPANYASKSKLVEGDVLKLTITRDGSFIYKQIGPIERQRMVGELIRDDVTGEYKVATGSGTYKVLLASITYFKGDAGDDVVILVPKEGDARWAAVENIIKKGPAEFTV